MILVSFPVEENQEIRKTWNIILAGMFLNSVFIKGDARVKDIVLEDYRTATVFDKWDIGYCCGGHLTLDATCKMRGIDPAELTNELEKVARRIPIPAGLPLNEWSTDFLVDYIVNIHHFYLRQTLPTLHHLLTRFVSKHLSKYPFLEELGYQFERLKKEMWHHMEEEEKILFPYIKQVAHAYEANDSYANLLVKTLRKPIHELMDKKTALVSDVIARFRGLTSDYSPDSSACTNHRVIFASLKEMDTDLTQHMYLENGILFPRAIAMENELLAAKD